MIFRTANEEDFPFLAEMRWDFRQESGEEIAVVEKAEFIEKCIDFLEEKAQVYTYWIAEIEGKIVSHIFVHTVSLVPRPCKIEDAFAYLTNVYTKPEFRRKGIGAKLLDHVIEWAKTKDFELLLVYPSDEAIDFYKRFGFEKDAEILKLALRNY
ncbi:MAG TPA: GNAT family N-acetyltransferase [Pyrinomonadaceae bacterium]|nr:GNAT family N-acetyltransferase [Pyrinomonadaceae bacterium]